MIKEPQAYLLHILVAIESIEKHLQGITEEHFYLLEEKQSHIIRKLEIIGEATKRISDEFKQQHPEVP
jgi:uncharacterized protein with HEPN domain